MHRPIDGVVAPNPPCRGPLGLSEGQISRLKNENAKQSPPGAANSEIGDLTDLRTTALARLAAQHEEITRLRNLTTTNPRSNIARLPDRRKDHRAMLTTTRPFGSRLSSRSASILRLGPMSPDDRCVRELKR